MQHICCQHREPCAPLELELSVDTAHPSAGALLSAVFPCRSVSVSPLRCPEPELSTSIARSARRALLFVPLAPPYAREASPFLWKPGGGVAQEVRSAASANGEGQALEAKSRDISPRRWPSHHPARPGLFLFRHRALGEWGWSRGRAASAPSRRHPCPATAPAAPPGAAGTAPPAWPGLSHRQRLWCRPEPPECGVGGGTSRPWPRAPQR